MFKYITSIIRFYKHKIKNFFYSLFRIKFLGKIIERVLVGKIEKRYFDYGLTFTRRNDKKNLLFYESINLISCNPYFHLLGTIENECLNRKIEFYISSFRFVDLIGSSNLIMTRDKRVIYDLKYLLRSKNIRYSDFGIKYYNNNFCLVKNNSIEEEIYRGIMMLGNYSWNYYHFLFEIISKFEKLNKLELDQDIPILMDEVSFEVPQYQELTNLFNTRNRKIKYLKKGRRYNIEKLYYLSPTNLIAPNFFKNNLISDHDIFLNPDSIKFLRSHLLKLAAKSSFPKRILLSRKNASKRRKYNEDEVFNYLENYGFVKVFPEELTILEQVSLFNGAEFIVGGSGAAFTNILFCNINCKIICFMNYKLNLNIFSTIASHLLLKMVYLTDESMKINKDIDLHDSYNIDVEKLNELVLRWL